MKGILCTTPLGDKQVGQIHALMLPTPQTCQTIKMHMRISKWCNYEGRGRKTNLDWMVRKNFIEEEANKEKSYSFTPPVK